MAAKLPTPRRSLDTFWSARRQLAATAYSGQPLPADLAPPQQPRHDAPLLPASLDDVDAEFVASALAARGYIEQATRVASFEKTKYGREKGYLGDKCLLTDIRYEPPTGGAPTSIFVKLFPTDLVIPAAACAGIFLPAPPRGEG